MNLFRVPLNLIVVTILILSNYFNSFLICLIEGCILIIPFLSSLYLIYYHYVKIGTGKDNIKISEHNILKDINVDDKKFN